MCYYAGSFLLLASDIAFAFMLGRYKSGYSKGQDQIRSRGRGRVSGPSSIRLHDRVRARRAELFGIRVKSPELGLGLGLGAQS